MTSLLLCALIAGTSVYTDTFNDANKAYLADDYHKAISLYEQLVSERITDPVVFYNLANAYYRTGQLAPAIANYERALQLDHRFDNARENLNTAVQQTQHRLERPLPPAWEQSVLFWHYGLPQRMTFMLAVGFWLAFWCVLALRQWRRTQRRRWVPVMLGVLAVAFCASAWVKAHPAMLAVANHDPVPVRYGTADDETVRFELYVGDRVTVDKRANGWSRVTTVDGQRGWAQDGHLIFVGPPYSPPSK